MSPFKWALVLVAVAISAAWKPVPLLDGALFFVACLGLALSWRPRSTAIEDALRRAEKEARP